MTWLAASRWSDRQPHRSARPAYSRLGCRESYILPGQCVRTWKITHESAQKPQKIWQISLANQGADALVRRRAHSPHRHGSDDLQRRSGLSDHLRIDFVGQRAKDCILADDTLQQFVTWYGRRLGPAVDVAPATKIRPFIKSTLYIFVSLWPHVTPSANAGWQLTRVAASRRPCTGNRSASRRRVAASCVSLSEWKSCAFDRHVLSSSAVC